LGAPEDGFAQWEPSEKKGNVQRHNTPALVPRLDSLASYLTTPKMYTILSQNHNYKSCVWSV